MQMARNTDLMGGSIFRVTTRSEGKSLAPKEGNSNIHIPPETGPDKDDNVTRPPQVPDGNSEQLNFRKDSKDQNLDEIQRANTSAEQNPEIVLNEAEGSLNVIQGYSVAP